MKFIHTSDWHIGRLFHNVSLLEDQIYAIDKIKELSKDHNIDALVISGDIYDRAFPPSDAVNALNHILETFIIEMNIPVIMIPGNHDSLERLNFGSRFMAKKGLHILGNLREIDRPVLIKNKKGEVCHFYGIPYNSPSEIKEIYGTEVKTYDDAHRFLISKINENRNQNEKSIPSVLLSHCFINNGKVSESERSLSIGGSDRIGWETLQDFDYVALGHLHSPQTIGKQNHIRYSGSLLKYSFSESKQEKSVVLVEIGEDGFVSAENLIYRPKRNVRKIKGKLQDIIERGKNDPFKDDFIFCFLEDKGALLDPMGKLRDIYPNILQIGRKSYQSNTELKNQDLEAKERNDLDVIKDFYYQIFDEEMPSKKMDYLKNIIDKVNSEGVSL